MRLADNFNIRDYTTLKEKVGADYARELVEESAIDPAVALERGYYMVDRPFHLVEDLGYPERWFTPWYVSRSKPLPDAEYMPPSYFDNEVDLPALVIPKRSADNELVIHEIKPYSHSFKDDRKYISPPKQEMVLDIHPRGFKHLKDTSVAVWITEGAKKADALTSMGLFSVNLSGAWGFTQRRLYGEEDPFLPCFDYIEWQGRTVVLAYDADAKANEQTQEAMETLYNELMRRGASEVIAVYAPPVDGDGKAGIDDYLASGGDLMNLYTQSGPYTRLDVSHERLARDPVLKESIEGLERYILSENWTHRSAARSILKVMTRIARTNGKMEERYFLDEEGGRYKESCILIQAAYRHLAELAALNKGTILRNIVKMEKAGILQRDKTLPRKQRDPMHFLLRTDVTRDAYNNGETPAERGTTISPLLIVCTPRHPLRLRNSIPRYGLLRLGKRAEEIIDVIGTSTGWSEYIKEEDLASLLGYKDRRSMRKAGPYKRLLSRGILVCEEDRVRLVSDWEAILQIAQKERQEHLSDEKQQYEHQKDRKIFREWYERKYAPEKHVTPGRLGGKRQFGGRLS